MLCTSGKNPFLISKFTQLSLARWFSKLLENGKKSTYFWFLSTFLCYHIQLSDFILLHGDRERNTIFLYQHVVFYLPSDPPFLHHVLQRKIGKELFYFFLPLLFVYSQIVISIFNEIVLSFDNLKLINAIFMVLLCGDML